MEKLKTHITLLVFFVLTNVITQSMEPSADTWEHDSRCQHVQNIIVSTCDTPNAYAGLDLIYWPTDRAINHIVNNWSHINHENRLEIMQYRKDIMCGVVEQNKDLSLAYELAKNSTVTKGVASVIVDAFLQTNINACLDDFNTVISRVFPEEILNYGNDRVLRKSLADVVTKRIKYYIEFMQDDRFFSIDDFFCDDLLKEEVSDYISVPTWMRTWICAVVDNDRNFFAVSYDESCVRIYDLNIGNTLDIIAICNDADDQLIRIKIKKIAFNKSNSMLLGILDEKDTMYKFTVPASFLKSEISLQELAPLVYCKVSARKVTNESMDCMGYSIFESQDFDKDEMLIKLIRKTCKTKLTPLFLLNSLHFEKKEYREVAKLRMVFDQMSKKLGVTRKQVAIDLYINNKQESWNLFNKMYPDGSTLDSVDTFRDVFKQKLHNK